MKLKQKKLVIAAVPAVMLLGACQVDSNISVTEDEHLSAAIKIVDDEGIAEGLTCADMEENMAADFPYATDFTIDDLGSDPLSCQANITFDDEFSTMALTKSGDSYTVAIPQEFWDSFNDSSQIEQFGDIDSSFTIEFPGEVSDASEGGEINGNTVTWEGYDTLSGGVEATGSATAGGTADEPTTAPTTAPADEPTSAATEEPTAAPSSDEDSDSGFPVWAWILIGVGAVILIGLILFFLLRGKNGKGNNQSGGYDPNNPYAGQAGYGQPGAPQGYGQQGQGLNRPGVGGGCC